jgi:hypothetical protein
MENKNSINKSSPEKIKEQEINDVVESILSIFDDCDLSAIEILGILEVIRHKINGETKLVWKEEE